ncbi:Prp21 protein [Saccharomycopsis crataegensis]|uniref:Prp21 protein n=1 Tax=Saccharomycopsis crataegensis TaxID=43959 RepID=A0AAV5QJ54_9ASCO|nr:Prp21 protein [Saccharomycopsis crataegensis]
MPVGEIPESVIIPPAKVKETIEKTAGYIARNGQQFASRLLRESGDKFSFLKLDDPFFGYYQFCLKDYRENSSTNANKSAAPAKDTNQVANDNKEKPPIPDEFQFMFKLPYANASDLETIKISALTCAVNDSEEYFKNFKKHVFELNQPQFEFLNDNHRLNPVFQKFVEQYKNCIHPPQKLIEKVNSVDGDDYKLTRYLLEKSYLRAEHNSKLQNDAQKAKQAEENAKLEYAMIDWGDFKIVTTVEFTETDKFSELPLPINKNDLIYRSLQQKKANSLLEEAPPDFTNDESYIPKPPKKSSASQPAPSQEENVDTISQKPIAPPRRGMKIKSAGETRLKKGGNRSQNQESLQPPQQKPGVLSNVKLVKSPITGELIPEDKFDLHMKIVLRDPKYEQEKQNYLRKNAVPSNITDNEVFANIKRLRGEEIGDINDTKRVKLQWDGYSNTAKSIQELADKQISPEEMEKIKNERYEKENKIGPQF